MLTSRCSIWQALLAFLTLGLHQQCHAVVTWDTIECDNVVIGGAALNDIWDNAALLASNAGNEIGTLADSSLVPPKTAVGRIADNAKWMFGIDVIWTSILPSSSRNTLTNTVS